MTLFDFKKRLEAARSQKVKLSLITPAVNESWKSKMKKLAQNNIKVTFRYAMHALEKPTCFGQNVKFERLSFALKHLL